MFPRLMIYLAVAAGLYLAWCAFLWLVQSKLLFPTAMAGPPMPEAATAR